MDGLDDLMSAFAGVNMDDHEELVESFARILGAYQLVLDFPAVHA